MSLPELSPSNNVLVDHISSIGALSMAGMIDLRAVEAWIAELDKLYAARAAYYGEERLLKKDIDFSKALLEALKLAVDLLRVDHWPPDDEQQCSCGRYTCELRTFWMHQAGVKSSKFPLLSRLRKET